MWPWLQSLVEPTDEIRDLAERRRARALASIVLAIGPLGLITITIQLFTRADFFRTFATNAVALLVLGVCARMARTRHYRRAAGVAVAVIVLACALAGLQDATDPVWWAYMVLGVLAATVLISIRGASLVALLAVVATVVVLLINETPLGLASAVVMVQLLIYPVLLVLSHHRNLIEEDRRAQQQALQAQLHESQRLETVGRVAGGVAHDFNNMLMVISASAHLARESTGDDLNELIDDIEAAGERGRLLTQQLLAFSRQQKLTTRLIALQTLVDDTTPILARLVGRERLTVVHDGEMASRIHADRSQLEQVLLNLVVNAAAATPPDGRIEVRTGVTAATSPEPPGEELPCAYLVVSDDGRGISEEVRARMFEPFFTTKADEGGTGLGLSTVHGIVHQLGGWLEVESVPSEGTTFRIFLPLVNDGTDEGAPTSSRVSSVSPAHRRVLIVDDEPAVLRSVARMLSHQGYDVLTAHGAADARAIWQREHESLHAVLCDVVMPDTDGLELVEELHREDDRVKVVLMSGFSAATLEKHGIEEIGLPLLRKPFSRDELMDTLEG